MVYIIGLIFVLMVILISIEDKENIEEVLKTMGLLTNIKEYVKN